MQPLSNDKLDKRLSAQGVPNSQTYYAKSMRKKKYNLYANSVIPSQHNTPLVTRKAKISEVRESSREPSRKRNILDTIQPISSLKKAWKNVTSSQKKPRHNVQSFAPMKDNWADKVYEFGNTTPNKPRLTPKMCKGSIGASKYLYQKTRDLRQPKTYSANTSTITKNSMNNISSTKEISFEKKEHEIAPKTPVPIEDNSESWTGNIFSKLRNWMSKELTVFPWKWSEQDEELNWWARAGNWVRKAESFRRQKPNMAKYIEEYQSLIKQLDSTYSADPNDSIATIVREGFEQQQNQIEKDIDRTLTDHQYFGSGKEGQEILRQILKILALKYTDIGYVQGMNFLVVSLLYHWSAEVTLFLITVLFEDYELWDVYRIDVSGLHERNQKIKNIITINLPDLAQNFAEIGLEPQMFTTEWILDLFSHIIPLNYYGKFLDTFISDGTNRGQKYGWDYFYAVIIWILASTEKELKNKTEWDEVLVFIKNYVKEKESFFSKNLNWDKILNMAVR